MGGSRQRVVRFGAVVLVAIGVAAATASGASAQDSTDATIQSAESDWAVGDGGVVSFDVTLTNLTIAELPLDVAVADDSTCMITAAPSSLAPNRPPQKVTIQLAADCDTSDGKLLAVIEAGDATFDVSVAEPGSPDTPWRQLQVFAWLLGATVLIAFVVWMIVGLKKAWKPLSGLDDKWDFKDAWATNVTALGAILTGVVGTSSVVEAILGEDADSAIALATVGAAMAAGIAVAAPIVLSILKRAGKFTLAGVLFANAFAISAALGELWVVAWSGSHLEKAGDREDVFIYLTAGVAAVILLVYVVVNTVAVWRTGTKDADPVRPSDELIAAALHVRYCCDHDLPSTDEYLALIKELGILVNSTAKPAAETTDADATVFEFDDAMLRTLTGPPVASGRGVGI